MDTEARMGGLAELRGRAWRGVVSQGEEGERDRSSPSSRAGLWASSENTGGLGVWVGVLGGDDRPEAGKTQRF